MWHWSVPVRFNVRMPGRGTIGSLMNHYQHKHPRPVAERG